ncbi:hypothetical protein ACHQM5_017290 [Ranunculus cassubicifolius]
MAPKEDANRLNQLEKASSVHEEGLDRLHQQCSDLQEGFSKMAEQQSGLKAGFARMEDQHSRDLQQVTAAIAKLRESIQHLTSNSDPVQVRMAAPPDPSVSATPQLLGKLNPGAASLLGTSPTADQSNGIPVTTSSPLSNVLQKLPQVDFPKFSGSHVRSLIQKAQRFFLLHPMSDQQKILYASLNFTDAADTWFQTDSLKFAALGWKDFSTLLQHRFSEELSQNAIGEFKLLCQKGSVKDYQYEFEQLQPLVLLQNPGLSEQYFVDSCIAGLSEDIKHSVQMFYPSTVPSVFALARLQEANVAFRGKGRGNKFVSNAQVYSPMKYVNHQSFNGNHLVVSKHEPHAGSGEAAYTRSPQSQPPIKRLSPSEIQERRSKGLCYNCDDVWSIKHKCKAKQLFLIVGDYDDTTELSDTASNPEPSDSSAPAIPSEVAISLHALSGNISYQTLLLKGRVKNRNLTMLVDTGSTHNFLDTNTAKALGCICTDTPAHQVIVAGGSHLTCNKVCHGFS